MGDHVFVSYAREDAGYVTQLVSHLRLWGIVPWSDGILHFGVEWPEAIAQRIDTCAAFVVVMSPAAHTSQWVRREVLRAQDQRKPIFPLLLKGSPLFAVSDLHYERATEGRMPSPRWIEHLRAAGHPHQVRATRPGQATSTTLAAWPHRPISQPAGTGAAHTSELWSVVFSPDGRQLATAGGGDSAVRLWDVATARRTVTLTGHTWSAWSGDGVCRRL